MRIVIVGDVHLSVVPPARRAEGYLEELFDMLHEIHRIACEQNAQTIFVGDCFHHKAWHRNPHWLVGRLMEVLSGFPNSVYIVPGNHDLADGSIESLRRQPIAQLDWVANVMVMAGHQPIWIPEPDLEDAGITMKAVLGTADVTEARDEAKAYFADAVDLIVAHAPLSPRELPWKTWHPRELPIDPKVRWLVYGHQHDHAGKWAIGEELPYDVVSSGCLARGSIREADTEPSVMVLDTVSGQWERKLLASARPVEEIYRWVEREEEIRENQAMTAFVDALGGATLAGFSREGLIATIGERSDLDVPVKQLAIEILESVR